MAAPADLPEWDTNETNTVQPEATQRADGWQSTLGTPEKPPFEWDNWWKNNVYKWINYLNSFTPKIDQNNTFTKTQYGTLITTAWSAAISLNASDGSEHLVTGTPTSAYTVTITTPPTGDQTQDMSITLPLNATYSPAFSATYFDAATIPPDPTSGGTQNIYQFRYNKTKTKFDCLGVITV